MENINTETLKRALGKALRAQIANVDFQSVLLRGGTVGEVRLVTGTAGTIGGERLPYRIVLKVQKKWERRGDPGSWRREYDLYSSGLEKIFTASLRGPECYHAEMNEGETEWHIWMEYIEGVSGYGLTAEMFERAAYEIGRFQGRLHENPPECLCGMQNLRKLGCLKTWVSYRRSQDDDLYAYLKSDGCDIPGHLREMVIADDDGADEVWARIENLPVVFTHGDFWYENIFYRDGDIVLVDWDSTGFGYMGEDVWQLLTDEMDIGRAAKYYAKCVFAYYKGFSEHVDVSHIPVSRIEEMVLFNLGARHAKEYMNANTPEKKAAQIDALQKIHDMRNKIGEHGCNPKRNSTPITKPRCRSYLPL